MIKTDRRADKSLPRTCILEEGKICDNCCECYVCDLDPEKICDSCGKCLETADYSGIIVDDIIMEAVWRKSAPPKVGRGGRKMRVKYRLRGNQFHLVRKGT